MTDNNTDQSKNGVKFSVSARDPNWFEMQIGGPDHRSHFGFTESELIEMREQIDDILERARLEEQKAEIAAELKELS